MGRMLALAATAMLVLGLGATGTLAGQNGSKTLVAKGKSPHGIAWTIKAAKSKTLFTFDFRFNRDPELGYTTGLSRPVSRRFVLSAVAGSSLGPYDESDVSGVTRRKVASLTIEFTNGSTLTHTPQRARKRARKKHRWTRCFRFYDQFFPSNLNPESVTAFDGEGQRLGACEVRTGVC